MEDPIFKIKTLIKIERSVPYKKTDGSVYWSLPGTEELHRDYGPAIQHSDGTDSYYKNGIRHRDDGPAIINLKTDYQAYYFHGKIHREDGPAIIQNGNSFYYLDGHSLSESEFKAQLANRL